MDSEKLALVATPKSCRDRVTVSANEARLGKSTSGGLETWQATPPEIC